MDFSLAIAEEKKAEGNQQYSRKNYEEAVKLYTEAIGNVIVMFKTRIQRKILGTFVWSRDFESARLGFGEKAVNG